MRRERRDRPARIGVAGFQQAMRWRAGVMTVLAGLFLLRVVGQALVTFAEVEWLPTVEH
ncbi:MAG: hypothetical protein M3R02_14070 [Chloroflexota bacterium]|nr:hypothetical protein [Chloroflexota bacterium]